MVADDGARPGANGVCAHEVALLERSEGQRLGDHHDRRHQRGVVDLDCLHEHGRVVQTLLERAALPIPGDVGHHCAVSGLADRAVGVLPRDRDHRPPVGVSCRHLDVVVYVALGALAFRKDSRLPERIRPQPNRQAVLGRRERGEELEVRVEAVGVRVQGVRAHRAHPKRYRVVPSPLDNIGGEVLDDSAVERAASVDRPRSCIAVAEIDPSSFAASFHAVQPGANGPCRVDPTLHPTLAFRVNLLSVPLVAQTKRPLFTVGIDALDPVVQKVDRRLLVLSEALLLALACDRTVLGGSWVRADCVTLALSVMEKVARVSKRILPFRIHHLIRRDR
mmetsp:Transcript_7568/g.17815  ORF Transcript_7568/g.17815 Transcript_7568/m.17815 type:complete len:335 (+) Transcript_7568:2358-3362(+)